MLLSTSSLMLLVCCPGSASLSLYIGGIFAIPPYHAVTTHVFPQPASPRSFYARCHSWTRSQVSRFYHATGDARLVSHVPPFGVCITEACVVHRWMKEGDVAGGRGRCQHASEGKRKAQPDVDTSILMWIFEAGKYSASVSLSIGQPRWEIEIQGKLVSTPGWRNRHGIQLFPRPTHPTRAAGLLKQIANICPQSTRQSPTARSLPLDLHVQ